MNENNCLLCGGRLAPTFCLENIFALSCIDSKPVCSECWQQFTYLPETVVCEMCGRFLDSTGSKSKCSDCERWLASGQREFINTALFEYNSAMKEFMRRYKFNGDYRLRLIFSRLVGQFIRRKYSQKSLIVVPVPVSNATLVTRGFNQVTGLLKNVRYSNCLRVIESDKPTQSTKTRFERLISEQPFELGLGCEKQLSNKTVLIVDDVYTTGTTIRHAAAAINQARPANVMGLTLAR